MTTAPQFKFSLGEVVYTNIAGILTQTTIKACSSSAFYDKDNKEQTTLIYKVNVNENDPENRFSDVRVESEVFKTAEEAIDYFLPKTGLLLKTEETELSITDALLNTVQIIPESVSTNEEENA